MPSTISQIIDRLEGRVIPTTLNVDTAPPGYQEMLQEAYRKNMRRRSRRLLQEMAPSDREAVLAYLENEAEIRQCMATIQRAQKRLKELGHNPASIQRLNHLLTRLAEGSDAIAERSHEQLISEHEMMGLFTGNASEVWRNTIL